MINKNELYEYVQPILIHMKSILYMFHTKSILYMFHMKSILFMFNKKNFNNNIGMFNSIITFVFIICLKLIPLGNNFEHSFVEFNYSVEFN